MKVLVGSPVESGELLPDQLDYIVFVEVGIQGYPLLLQQIGQSSLYQLFLVTSDHVDQYLEELFEGEVLCLVHVDQDELESLDR